MNMFSKIYLFFLLCLGIAAIAQWALYRVLNKSRNKFNSWLVLLLFFGVIVAAPLLAFRLDRWYCLVMKTSQDNKLIFGMFFIGILFVLNLLVIWMIQRRGQGGFGRSMLNAVLCTIAAGFLMVGISCMAFIPPLAPHFFFPDTTIYSSDFVNKNFNKVKVGMSMGEVEKLLGTPFHKVDLSSGLKAWIYSKSSCDSHYYYRSIHFYNGVVLKKEAYYYID